MSTETSTYENETTAATDMLCEACALNGIWTRAERLAEAQVHATLAVAAAVVAGISKPVTSNIFVEKPEVVARITPWERDAIRKRLGLDPLPDAFTGSERADEVGA